MISKGVPFDVAFALDPAEIKGFTVVFSELDGSIYDWDTGEWTRD